MTHHCVLLRKKQPSDPNERFNRVACSRTDCGIHWQTIRGASWQKGSSIRSDGISYVPLEQNGTEQPRMKPLLPSVHVTWCLWQARPALVTSSQIFKAKTETELKMFRFDKLQCSGPIVVQTSPCSFGTMTFHNMDECDPQVEHLPSCDSPRGLRWVQTIRFLWRPLGPSPSSLRRQTHKQNVAYSIMSGGFGTLSQVTHPLFRSTTDPAPVWTWV